MAIDSLKIKKQKLISKQNVFFTQCPNGRKNQYASLSDTWHWVAYFVKNSNY